MMVGTPPIWHCHPNTLLCQAGHAMVLYRTGFHVDQSRVDGHLVVACQKCSPTSYAFAIIHSRPSPIVHLYAIDRAQYDALRDVNDARLEPPLVNGRETEDLLFRLGYNPTFARSTA